MNNLGLSQEELIEIENIFLRFKSIKKVKIFGSRAKGNYKRSSDVDIAVYGFFTNQDIVGELSYILNQETFMPYKFDVLNYYKVENLTLKDHIDKVGMVIYESTKFIDSDTKNS